MSKVIGIIGAMDIEVEKFIENLSNIEKVTISGIDFYSGTAFGKKIVVIKSGVGKVFASIATEILCIKFGVSCVINTGVAGALYGLKIGDIVVSNSVCQHDMDTSAIGDPIGLISGINKVYLNADENLVSLALSSANKNGLNAVSCIIASGDKFVAGQEEKEYIYKNFSALCVEMEGASVGQTAYLNSVPFIVIRAISDDGDDSHAVEFVKFAKESAIKANAIICDMLQNI